MKRRHRGVDCPPLEELISPARRRLLPEADYPLDPWRLVERRLRPGELAQTETLFCVANGYVGVRGTPEEGAPLGYAATYLNGFYESWPISYAEAAYGFPEHGQSMVPVVDATLLKLYVDDEPLDLRHARVLEFERVLDFRAGLLQRDLVYETPAGQRLQVRSRRFASFAQRHLVMMDYEVRLLRGRAELTLSSELHVPEQMPLGDPQDPRSGAVSGLLPLQVLAHRSRGWRALLNLRARHSDQSLACAMDHRAESDAPLRAEPAACRDGRARTVFFTDLEEGQRLRLVKYAAYHHASDADAGELRFRTHRTLDKALQLGWDGVYARHRERLDAFWAVADIELQGDLRVQQTVRFNLYQLAQATLRSEGFGLPAKGLTGRGYEGHYFWDTEIYVLPFLSYTAPRVARSLLRMRYRHLGRARERARELNQAGALFPWRTIDGREASAHYAAGTAQYHINADVVYAARSYAAIAGDRDFLYRELLEIAVETARMWVDLGFYSPRRGGQFCINGVTGPDEYNTVVDNNAYTNLMARENLLFAADLVTRARREAPELLQRVERSCGLRAGEPRAWRRAARALYLPYDEALGVYLQDDGFLERKPWDLSRVPPERFPLLLHYHPLVIYRHQVIKQADLMLACVLLDGQFTLQEKRRIFEVYDPLTTGDSSLSGCIQSILALQTGEEAAAYRYFADALAMDFGDIGGNLADGLHIAALGGSWMMLVRGFAGLRERDDGALSFQPRLPRGWSLLRFRLRVRESVLEVSMSPARSLYRLIQGPGLRVWHGAQRVDLDAARPERELPTALERASGG